eukprot:5240115-Lingulodinium_polyedra.AAC.1
MQRQREPPAPRNGRRPSTGRPARVPTPNATAQRARVVAAPHAGRGACVFCHAGVRPTELNLQARADRRG